MHFCLASFTSFTRPCRIQKRRREHLNCRKWTHCEQQRLQRRPHCVSADFPDTQSWGASEYHPQTRGPAGCCPRCSCDKGQWCVVSARAKCCPGGAGCCLGCCQGAGKEFVSAGQARCCPGCFGCWDLVGGHAAGQGEVLLWVL